MKCFTINTEIQIEKKAIRFLNNSLLIFSHPCHPQARYTKHPPSYLTRHFRSLTATLLSANGETDGRVAANQRVVEVMRTWVKWHIRHKHGGQGAQYTIAWWMMSTIWGQYTQYSGLHITPTRWMSLRPGHLTTWWPLHWEINVRGLRLSMIQ